MSLHLFPQRHKAHRAAFSLYPLCLWDISQFMCDATLILIPVGMALVHGTGTKQYGSSNITTSCDIDHYIVDITQDVQGSIPFMTPLSAIAKSATYVNPTPTCYWVYIWDAGGDLAPSGFNIVIFKP